MRDVVINKHCNDGCYIVSKLDFINKTIKVIIDDFLLIKVHVENNAIFPARNPPALILILQRTEALLDSTLPKMIQSSDG